jgi:hypothetical protein
MRSKEFITEKSNASAIQNTINNKINSIFDIDELNQIYSYIRKIDIGGGFEAVFQKDEDLRQINTLITRAMIDVKAPFEDKINFAKELVENGIINIDALMNSGVKQQLTDIVQTAYPGIFQQIYPELINIAGAFASGGKKTQRGKGEFFLAISSPRISMSKDNGKGDLVIDKSIWLEVKSNLSRIKGRNGYGTTDAAYQKIKTEIPKFLKKNLPKIAAPAYSVGIGQRSTFWNEFGPFCISNGVPANLVIKFIKSHLAEVIKSMYINIDNGSLTEFMDCIDSTTGSMAWPDFVNITKRVAFQYYKNSDEFNGILLINGDSCLYVENAEQFVSSVRLKKLGFETGQQNGLQIEFK